MKNTLLYIVTVLIWGSTWIAIEFQIDEAPVVITLFYRFAFAFLLMLIFALWRKLPLSFKAKDHGFFFLLALMNFSMNYFILYEAQKYLNSAMTSIAFSTMLLINIINTRIFFGVRIKPKVYLGAVVGLAGIFLLFYPTIAAQNFDRSSLIGLVLVLAGTLVASLGNMVSVRNSRNGLPILSANTWGMFYGSAILLAVIMIRDVSFVFPATTSYWISLSYVTIFGTVIAFASYFMLLRNLGPERASYVIVLFPVVAIIISIFVEDFQITPYVLGGILLVALGNIIVLTPLEKLPFFKSKRVRKPITAGFVSIPK
ncbi:MAG: EamA family transporter [Gammaproteobacteria bacterium]|nr:MAG: EamA family transporter [Gammaproteobacteria bacterium]